MEWVARINELALAPDLTLFLEVDPAVAAERRARRGGESDLFEVEKAQRAIALKYVEAIDHHGERQNVVRIDGGQPPEVVTASALAAIARIL
jgi:dTMP kinase